MPNDEKRNVPLLESELKYADAVVKLTADEAVMQPGTGLPGWMREIESVLFLSHGNKRHDDVWKETREKAQE